MSKKDTKFETQHTNVPAKGLDKTEQVGARFNLHGKMAEGYEAASPDAQRRIRDQVEIRESRLKQRTQSQKFWHDRNVAEEKNKLFEKHFANPSPQPNTPEANLLVHETITEQAERTILERDANSLMYIGRESDANIKEIMHLDKKGMLLEHGGHELDEEHENKE